MCLTCLSLAYSGGPHLIIHRPFSPEPTCFLAGATLISAGLLLGSLIADTPAFALGDGPRAYQLVPAGSQILSFGYLGQDGNSSFDTASTGRGAMGDVEVGYLPCVTTFKIASQQSAAFAVIPCGDVTGTLELGASPSLPTRFPASVPTLAVHPWRHDRPDRRAKPFPAGLCDLQTRICPGDIGETAPSHRRL